MNNHTCQIGQNLNHKSWSSLAMGEIKVIQVWVTTQTAKCKTMSRTAAIETWVVYFQRYHCFSV